MGQCTKGVGDGEKCTIDTKSKIMYTIGAENV